MLPELEKMAIFHCCAIQNEIINSNHPSGKASLSWETELKEKILKQPSAVGLLSSQLPLTPHLHMQ